jgi:hypothetical protein
MMSDFNKRTVLAAIAFMRHAMLKRLSWAGLPIVGSQEKIDECSRCLHELDRAEREVRAS